MARACDVETGYMADLCGMQHVLVIGGTGRIGQPVAEELAQRGAHVRIMTRSLVKAASIEASGMHSVIGDLNRSHSLHDAFSGVDVLVLITAHSITETGQGLAAVSTALAAGVRRVVFLSSAIGSGAMRIPHVASKAPIEHSLITSRSGYTIVRAHNVYQNDLCVPVAEAISNGEYPLPIGSAGISRIDVRDVAMALANAALNSGHERRIYTLGAAERFTGESIAAAYGARYRGDDLDRWERTIALMKPRWQRDDLRIMLRYYQECGLSMSLQELGEQERLLGGEPRCFADFVSEQARTLSCSCAR
jgi:uncharacterized protein YbjT (DUF2867 family)